MKQRLAESTDVMIHYPPSDRQMRSVPNCRCVARNVCMLPNVPNHVMFDEIIIRDKKKGMQDTHKTHTRPCFECISKKSPLQCLDHID